METDLPRQAKQVADKIVNIESAQVVNLTINHSEIPSPFKSSPMKDNGNFFITDSGENRYILDDYDDIDLLGAPPSSLYVLSLFFITLSTSEVNYFVVLDSVAFRSPAEIDAVSSAFQSADEDEQFLIKRYGLHIPAFSVPYTLWPVHLDGPVPNSVGEIKAVFNAAMNEAAPSLDHLQEDLLQRLGITSAKIQYGKKYIEYCSFDSELKHSRCNFVQEFFVHTVSEDGIRNLVDPEGLRNFRYLPLPVYGDEKNVIARFAGRYTPYHIIDALRGRMRRMISLSNKVTPSMLTLKEYGVLFAIEYFDSPDSFDPQVEDILNECFIDGKINRFVTKNTLAVGVLPEDMISDFELYHTKPAGILIAELLEDISTELHEAYPQRKNLLLCSIEDGEYSYGKCFGLTSQTLFFTGDAFDRLQDLHRNLISIKDEIIDDPTTYTNMIAVAKEEKHRLMPMIDGQYYSKREMILSGEKTKVTICFNKLWKGNKDA